MNLIAQKIIETRKAKGLTQEEVAELSNVNLRTIQRIENSENEPRGKTLSLICNALEMDLHELSGKKSLSTKNYIDTIINFIFLIPINLVLIAILGFLTLDTNSNLNSIFAAFLLSLLIPFSIVIFTKNMENTERLFKFGVGYFLYFILITVVHGFPLGFVSGLFPCILINLFVLYFGNQILKLVSIK